MTGQQQRHHANTNPHHKTAHHALPLHLVLFNHSIHHPFHLRQFLLHVFHVGPAGLQLLSVNGPFIGKHQCGLPSQFFLLHDFFFQRMNGRFKLLVFVAQATVDLFDLREFGFQRPLVQQCGVQIVLGCVEGELKTMLGIFGSIQFVLHRGPAGGGGGQGGGRANGVVQWVLVVGWVVLFGIGGGRCQDVDQIISIHGGTIDDAGFAVAGLQRGFFSGSREAVHGRVDLLLSSSTGEIFLLMSTFSVRALWLPLCSSTILK